MKRYLRFFMASMLMMLGYINQAIACSGNYGTQIGEFDGYPAYSNGNNDDCTGTGSGTYQCVEFVKRVHGISGSLTGCSTCGAEQAYYYLPSVDSDFTSYPNGGSVAPEVGDIIGFSGGGYGHVGIAGEVGSNYIIVVDQNRNSSSAYMTCSMSTSGGYTVTCSGMGSSYAVQGWIRNSEYNPIVCTTYTYSINLVTAEASGTSYNLYGYAEMGTGDSAIFDGTGALQSSTGSTSSHEKWLVGDVNADGWDDVIEITDSGSYTYAQVYTGFGGNGLNSRTQWVKTTTGVLEAFVEDMNNDNKDDLIIGYNNAGNMSWRYFLSTGSRFGTSDSNYTTWSTSFGKTSDIFVIGDFKNNGKGELLRGQEADGSTGRNFSSALTWKRLPSGSSTSSTVYTGYGYSGDQWLAEDVDNDGDDDLVRIDLDNSTVGVHVAKYTTSTSVCGSGSTGCFNTATNYAADVGGTDGTYYMYPIDYMDNYTDLLRVHDDPAVSGSTSDALSMSRSSGGTSYEEQTYQGDMLTGMTVGIDYLFGYFGDYDVEVCE